MSVRKIVEHLHTLYDIEISPDLINMTLSTVNDLNRR